MSVEGFSVVMELGIDAAATVPGGVTDVSYETEIVTKPLTTQADVDRNLVYARAGYAVSWPQINPITGEVQMHQEHLGFGIDGLTNACRTVVMRNIGLVVRVTPNPIVPNQVNQTVIARYTRMTGFWVHVGGRTPLESMVIETAEQEALEQGMLPLDAIVMGEQATSHLYWLLMQPQYIHAATAGIDTVTAIGLHEGK